MASSARFLIFSTEASRANAISSRARMISSDSAAIPAMPVASQPSQSARVKRSRISASVHSPIASVTSDAERAEEDCAKPRAAARRDGGRRLAGLDVGIRKHVDLGRHDDSDVGFRDGAGLAARLRVAPARGGQGSPRLVIRCGTLRVGAVRSCQPVSDQELQCAVEPDMRQRQRDAFGGLLDPRRPEPHETHRRLVRRCFM